MATSTTTLEGHDIIKEGWLTVYKSRNPTFLTKQKPDKVLERAWGVMHAKSAKGPLLSFYQDSHKETRVLRRDKVELLNVRALTKLSNHPKHSHCFTLKMKGKRNRFLFDCDDSHEAQAWLTAICDILQLDFKLEKVIWEFLDDSGLWLAVSDHESFTIESYYCEQQNTFSIGEYEQVRCHYNLGAMHRLPPKTKHTQRIKRTPFIWEKPAALHQKMKDLPAIWEWGDPSKDEWHPFERDTNIQIEDMYDSGAQWAELTLCMPSPTLLLLNLQDMKLVNSRTQVRFCLRRIDNSANMVQDPAAPDPRSPSPDDDEGQGGAENIISPISPLFQPLQSCLQHLQVSRKSIKFNQLLGEGAFGEVYLCDITNLPGHEGVTQVAVKQLRLSDFIARHGHHSQQMEDFLREAKEMAKVNNHRVVKLMAVCTLDFPLLLIEEYMNMGDLLGVLKDSRPLMPLVQQLTFAWQVADGMNYLATELQCVHRDLAARNVMVHKTDNGEMLGKIADFGLSRHLYSEMYKHQGTKPRPLPAKWMALESLMYFIFTTKSDVWSFGVMLWEIMSLGRTPYPGIENRELLEQIEENGLKLSKPKSCPQVVYTIILDCTDHVPDERPRFGELQQKLYDLYELAKVGELECSNDVDEPENRPNCTDMKDKRKSSSEPTTQNEQRDEATVVIGDDFLSPQETPTEETPQAILKTEPLPLTDQIEMESVSDKQPESAIHLEEIEIGVTTSQTSIKEVSEIGHVYYVIEQPDIPSTSSTENTKNVLEASKTTPTSVNGSVPSKII